VTAADEDADCEYVEVREREELWPVTDTVTECLEAVAEGVTDVVIEAVCVRVADTVLDRRLSEADDDNVPDIVSEDVLGAVIVTDLRERERDTVRDASADGDIVVEKELVELADVVWENPAVAVFEVEAEGDKSRLTDTVDDVEADSVRSGVEDMDGEWLNDGVELSVEEKTKLVVDVSDWDFAWEGEIVLEYVWSFEAEGVGVRESVVDSEVVDVGVADTDLLKEIVDVKELVDVLVVETVSLELVVDEPEAVNENVGDDVFVVDTDVDTEALETLLDVSVLVKLMEMDSERVKLHESVLEGVRDPD
jgi:hypothetical protein